MKEIYIYIFFLISNIFSHFQDFAIVTFFYPSRHFLYQGGESNIPHALSVASHHYLSTFLMLFLSIRRKITPFLIASCQSTLEDFFSIWSADSHLVVYFNLYSFSLYDSLRQCIPWPSSPHKSFSRIQSRTWARTKILWRLSTRLCKS